jgi:hypothetical protein
MARRKTKKTRRRRSSNFNIINALELYVQTDVLTRNIMGTNPFTALTGMESNQVKAGPVAGSLGYYPQFKSVTLPELLGLDKKVPAGVSGQSQIVEFGQGFSTMKANFSSNLFPMIVQTIGVRAGFAIGKRLLSKQRSFVNNKVFKAVGLKGMVSV